MKIQPVNVFQSETEERYGEYKPASSAIDGDMSTKSETICKYDERVWFRMVFKTSVCFEMVKIYPSHPGYYRQRLDNTEIFVGRQGTESRVNCGVMKVQDLQKNLYTIPCNKACGDVIELEVLHEAGAGVKGCIHMFEIEAYTDQCPGGYYVRNSDDSCEPCPDNYTYSAGGDTSQCLSLGKISYQM